MIDQQLQGKKILITGGSMGIGFACAAACRRAGADVLICARTESSLRKASDDLTQIPAIGTIQMSVCDVSDASAVERLFDEARTVMGGVNGVIHAAGIYGAIGSVVDVDPEAWLDTLRVNLFGTFLIGKMACQYFRRHGGGRIVFFAGGGASNAFPFFSAYACSKVAVVRFTETLAEEMRAEPIAVNCIAPGFVATRLHEATLQAKDSVDPEVIIHTQKQLESGGVPASCAAKAAVFLVSDSAAGISGRFVSAVYDRYEEWPSHIAEMQGSDLFTLRRIVPKDRGANWQ